MDEETKELTPVPFSCRAREATGQVENYGLDEDTAEQAMEWVNGGLDEDLAVEFAKEGF